MKDIPKDKDVLRAEIQSLVAEYAQIQYQEQEFHPSQSVIAPSGKLLDGAELQNMVDAALDGWLTTGRFNQEFEEKIADFLKVDYALTTNSGSSANLLALSCLTSPKLKDKALKPGDEVITVAAGFPTTVNPILQLGLVPVFVDIEIPTYNIDVRKLEAAKSAKTRAIMLAHTLGNPFDLDAVMAFARKHDLWVIEDSCDALGSLYTPSDEISNAPFDPLPSGTPRLVGTFGHVGTLSFYPAHHITMGEGGCVFTQDNLLKTIVTSFRDWGRDCFCAPGEDNSCGLRFCRKIGDLPAGYDHKYTYSHLGYNLKITDMQAACGVAQLDKLTGFIEKRKSNFAFLKKELQDLEDLIILPEATRNSDPAWFGFPITLRDTRKLRRSDVQMALEQRKIGTRLLFAGNLVRQPYMADQPYRISENLEQTDLVMEKTFWLGVQPALSEEMLAFSAQTLKTILKNGGRPR